MIGHILQIVEKWPPRPFFPKINRMDYKKLGIKLWFFMDLYLAIDYLKTFDFFHFLSEYEQVSWDFKYK